MDISGTYYCSRCMRRIEDDRLACPHCGYDPAAATVSRQHLAEGTFLNDRYQLGAVIGAGGCGVTYAAWDENLAVPVAIKEYFPARHAYRNVDESDELLPGEESRMLFAMGLTRFRREAQVLAQFRNVPGVVNINECFDENGTAYIAMEFVRGVPLDEYVLKNRPSPRRLLEIMLPAIDALESIHRQGVNHRDIKPDNLLVQEDGAIKLIDFGSAREVEHVTNMIVVSDGYAPLEQYDLELPQGPWADVYGVSATIYHMLTGTPPEAAVSRVGHDLLQAPSKKGVRLKKHQENALMAGLAVDPKKRIQSMAEFRALLYNMPLPEEVRRRRALMRRAAAAAMAMLVMLAAVVVNFTCGLPLGEGLLYALHPDGWHVVGSLNACSVVDVPEARIGIGVSAVEATLFHGREDMRQINIPPSVKRVDFSSVAMPKMLTVCGDSGSAAEIYAHRNGMPFLTAGGYTYADARYYDGGVELLTLAAPSGDGHAPETYVLPTYVDGLPVFLLGDGLSLPDSCTRVVLPACLQSIPEGMFSIAGGSPVLQSVDLGNELSVIESDAFAYHGLTSVVLPESVTHIGDRAFYDTPLLQIGFPESLTFIGRESFRHTRLNSVAFPPSLNTIGDYAFADTAIYSVAFPETVTDIGTGAFSATNITEVSLSMDLDHLGDSAFSECKNLLSAHVNAYDYDPMFPGRRRLPDFCFSGSMLKEATLTGTVEEIGRSAFADCVQLAYVSVPDGLTSIDESAFRGCTALKQIIIPDSVTYIHDNAFAECGDFTIICAENSYAQRYARAHGYDDAPVLSLLKEEHEGRIPPAGVLPFHASARMQDGPEDPAAQYALGNDFLNGLDGRKKDEKEAVRWYTLSAGQGYAPAQYALGVCYASGIGVARSDPEAEKWLTLAAEQNHADALYALALICYDEIGGRFTYREYRQLVERAAMQGHPLAQYDYAMFYPVSSEEALLWCTASAKQGCIAAQNQLGFWYAKGIGVEQNWDTAVSWYRLSAVQGDAGAQNALGDLYIAAGPRQNCQEAAAWYLLAAQQGHPDAQNSYGCLLERGIGVQQDDEEALRWYRLAAEQGSTPAQCNAGLLYMKQQRYEEARQWLLLAAEDGNATAQFNLGVMYEEGLGVAINDEKAADWFMKASVGGDEEAVARCFRAAEAGNVYAQNNLGMMYTYGWGVEKNPDEAVRWYRIAAEQGHAAAQAHLGSLYEYGIGVERNTDEAIRWYQLAAGQGDAFAAEALGYLLEQ